MKLSAILSIFIFLGILTGTPGDPEDLLGFKPERVSGQLQLERQYDEALDPVDLRQWMAQMTQRPHHAGSVQVKKNAEFMAEQFREWGYDTEIEVFHILFPTPKRRQLTLLSPYRYEAQLKEPSFPEDPVAGAIEKEGLPAFNAYSADGDVTGELVYVNQGIPRDYEVLARMGIDVKGKIVIARYGGSWRGIKPKVAAEHGALGCILYNDPKSDGFYQGSSYPDGPFKHDQAVQRGSVLDLPLRPGDPLTPGYGATKDAKRLPREKAETIMKIPVLPISYKDAKPLISALGGPVAPASWRGAMPVTYRIGPGPARVRLNLEFNWDLVPAYNVIAKMPGKDFPDQWVIRGNHHDAWVVGAKDPISGIVTVMAQAKAFAQLAKTGWRPRRTIVFAAWDAEEPALLGSTDWVEHHAAELAEKAVAYINTDGNSRGFLYIGGSHALETLANQAAQKVMDPQTGVTVAQRLRSRRLTQDNNPGNDPWREGFHLSPLGSGSDYSAFLQHLGVASFNLGFGGEGRGGEYHTNFDTFYHYSRFHDPQFDYGIALSKLCGRLSLRLLDADVLPFDFKGTVQAIKTYKEEVVSLAEEKRNQITRRNRLISERHFRTAADPTETYHTPTLKEPMPHLNFAPLKNAVDHLARVAEENSKAVTVYLQSGQALSLSQREALDRYLYTSERLLTHKGLPRRPWFRHQIYAPGFYTGYGVKTLPGIREAIEQDHWQEAEQQIQVTASVIANLAKQIEAATRLLTP